MPAAANIGSQTNHGTSLFPGPGSPDVLIGGKPAWRAPDDFHSCPRFTGNVAHVGGKVSKGSTSVKINSRPAVREGDKITENVPEKNIILKGESTVLIG